MKQTTSKSEIVKQLAPYIGLGFQFATTIGIGIVLGYVLDLWLQTSPYVLLACVLVFSVVAMISFFRTVTKTK